MEVQVQHKERLRGPAGFSLVELLVVVAIMGLIVAIAIPAFSRYKMRGYKATLDYDTKSVYLAAQSYLVDHNGATVDSISKLRAGGYNASENIILVNGSIAFNSGNIEIYSEVLKSQNLDNNSVIFGNGRIERANDPLY